MNPFRNLLAVCLLLLGALGARGGVPDPGPGGAGIPLVRNFTARSYGAEAQNWAVLQDHRGLIYAGNNRGVLEYDGARWRLIPTTRRTVVRSLDKDAWGRIYVGAVGEIGYLAPDAQGQLGYVSLLDRVPEAVRGFSDVWVTRATPQGILFQSREYLLLLKEDRVEVLKASTTFHLAFVVGRRIFVRQREIGLQELKGGSLTLVAGGERFARDSVFTMLSMGPGGKGDGDPILVGTRTAGFWRLGVDGLTRFPTAADSYLKAQVLYSGARLPDGTHALATIKGGVVILDTQGQLQRILDRRIGLLGDNVKALCPDRESGLWLALDNGLSRVEWPSPLSLFDERNGLTGTVWAIRRFQDRLYVATGQGAFVLTGPGRGGDPGSRFVPLAGVDGQSLAFLPLEDRMLLGSAQGLFEIRGHQARPVRPSSNVAITLYRSRRDPSRIFMGMQGGLVVLDHPPGSSLWRDLGGVPGLVEDIYSMAEDEEGRLWLGTATSEAIRLSFPKGWPGGPGVGLERFGVAQGLPTSFQPQMFRWGGRILAATQAGVLIFDEGRGRFLPEPRLAALFPEGPRVVKAVQVDDLERVWMDTLDEARGVHETGLALPVPGGALRWEVGPFRRFAELSIEAIQVDASGLVWFGGPTGLMRYDPALARRTQTGVEALIRRVTREGTLLLGGDGPLPETGEGPAFPFMRGALRFEFACPSFDHESGTRYQVRLSGYEGDWSPWTADAQKDYTNLPGGRYCFEVRARNIHGQVSPVQSLSFRVLPPWFRTTWATLLFLVAGILAGGLVLRLWTRYLWRRNQALQRRIELATEDLRDRERQLASQASALERMNAQLRELSAQKNQFLGIVAHDLRNPLTSIMLTSQLIQEEEDVADMRRRAGAIARVGGEMEHLINSFLDLSALETGGIRSEPGPLCVAELLDELVQRHGPWAEAKNIALRIESAPATARVFADTKFVSAVLDNLISNAIKFSPRESTVLIRVENIGGQVRVSVVDEGPGLNEADRARLFGRFARLSAQPTGGEKSVGLGLSIAKQMVEACGGRIWVESEPGQGAAFIVELPGSEF